MTDPVTPTILGAILDLESMSRGERERFRVAFSGDPRFAGVALRFLKLNQVEEDQTAIQTRRQQLQRRALQLRLDPSSVHILGQFIDSADPRTGRSMLEIFSRASAGLPFVIVRLPPMHQPIPKRFLQLGGEIFDKPIEFVDSIDVLRRVSFSPWSPNDLLRDSDKILLNVVLGHEEGVIDSWIRFLETTSIDDQHHFAQVAPIVRERLARAGYSDDESARLDGIARRTLYRNALMRIDVGTTIGNLRAADCHPVLGGDLISSIEAEREGTIRPAQYVELFVEPDENTRALRALRSSELLSSSMNDTNLSPNLKRTRCDFRFRSGQILTVKWEWLPHTAALATPLSPTRHVHDFMIDEENVRVFSPTARLISHWARPRAFFPQHLLSTIVLSTELIKRHRQSIVWNEAQAACEALGILPQVTALLSLIPDPLRAEIPSL